LLKRVPISRGTLRNWMSNGSIPFIRAKGRRLLFDWPSVREALLRMQRGGAN
jgi:predicted site-specific integrase-resolvase